jgi:hypothetical protein
VNTLTRTQAACANHPHTDWWLSSAKADRDRAVAICRTCPLLVSCREDAIRRRLTDSVRGGLTRPELRKLAGPARREVRHGSRSCYVAGCRRAECRLANRLYVAAWRARRVVTPSRTVVFVTEPNGQMAILVGSKR